MYTDCKYQQVEGDKVYCKLAFELCAIKTLTNKQACEHCSNLPNARTHNEVTASLAINSVKENKPEELKQFIGTVSYLLKKETIKPTELGPGPGTELKKILSWFAVDTPSCKCTDRANLMNVWGPEGCRNNINTILDWLQEEANNRGMPFVKAIAKQLVLLAISRAESCTPKDATSSI